MAEEKPANLPKASRELIKAQNGSYEVIKPLATGLFGAIYKVKREGDGKLFAMKCESLRIKKSILRQASSVLQALTIPSNHFVTIEERGNVPGRFLFVVYPLLGKNLKELIEEVTDKKYTITSALRIAEQTLASIRDLHRNGFIHRDIKPSHFCIGLESEQQHHAIFFLDFGLCKRPKFKTEVKVDLSDEEKQLRKGAIHYRGVVRYASIMSHCGKDLGFRDDMESWFYILIELITGQLPWALLAKNNEYDVAVLKSSLRKEDNLNKVLRDKKLSSSLFDILAYINMPKALNEYVDYDKIYITLIEIYDKIGANKNSPPDWDCLADYNGPPYQTNLVKGKCWNDLTAPMPKES